jgi:hypothetical protein
MLIWMSAISPGWCYEPRLKVVLRAKTKGGVTRRD